MSTANDGESPDGDRRQAIALTALTLFLEKGYAGTSMSAVARAVGLRKASLYSHFDSKEELFVSALAADVAAPLAEVEAVNARTDDPADARFIEALGLFYDAMVDSSIGAMATVVSETGQMVPAVAEGFHDNFLSRFRLALAGAYDPCVAAGTHRDIPLVTVHDIVFGPLLTIALTDVMFRRTPHVARRWNEGRSRAEFVTRIDAVLRI